MASTVAVLALAAVASAQTGNPRTKPVLPSNSQIGGFRFPIACKVFGLPLSLDGYYTATAATYAGPGQPLYYTDATAVLTVPQSIVNLGAAFGIDHADTQVFVDIAADNVTPSSRAVFPNGLWVNDTKLQSGQTLTVRVPPTGVIPPIGPFVAGAAGTDNNIFLGDVSAKVSLFNKAGKKLITAPISCPKATNPVDLGTVSIRGPANSTVSAPSNGFKPNFPALQDNQEFGFFRINYPCNIGPLKNIPVDLIFGGQLFSSYAAGEQFSLTNITSFLTVPQNFIDAAKIAYKAKTFTTTVNNIQLGVTNASPSSFNALKSPATLSAPVTTTGGLQLTLPATGTLEIGLITAGSTPNDYMVLSLGSTTGSVAIKDSTGATTFSGALSCAPVYQTNIYEILISAPASK